MKALLQRMGWLGLAVAAFFTAACDLPPPEPIPSPPPAAQAAPPVTVTAANPIAVTVDAVTVRGYQGLILAELAYEGAVVFVSTGVDAGVIRGETAAKIQVLNREAMAWLTRGKRAVDQSGKAQAAAEVVAIVFKIRALAAGS